jgi:hypothetical protein
MRYPWLQTMERAFAFVLSFALVIALAPLACDSNAHLPGWTSDGGGNGTGGNGTGGGGGGGGGITVTDGGIVIPDGGMPTNCTIGASGAIAVIPTETMAPGTACGTCHLAIGKPLYISGTVYPTYHEPDLCLGVTDVTIELVDANNATHSLPVDSSGNFLDNDLFALWPAPWTVAVVKGTARRPMVGTVTNGDCNSCHTAPGANSAPGRILTPDATPAM